jgi:O-antigen/teichoic acid export membrane protein
VVSTAEAPQSLTPGELQQAAASGAIWTLVHTLTAIPLAFAVNAVVARSLGAAEYGHLALITMAMAIISGVTNFGVSEAVQQWGAAAHARGDHAEVDRILRSSLGFHILVQLPLMTAAAFVLGHSQPGWVKVALLLSVMLPPLMGSSSLCINIENLTARSSRLSMATNLVMQAAVALVAVATHLPVAVWTARTLVPALTQPLNLLLLTPHRRRVAFSARLPRLMPAGFWRFSLLTAAAGFLGVLVVSRSEIVLLQWLGTPEMVGIFALAFGIASQLRGPVEALLAPMLPGIAGIVEVHPHLAAKTLLRSLRISALFSSAILLGLPLLVAALPAIYGQEFAKTAALLPVLAIAALMQALINPLLAFARAQHATGRILRSNLLSLGFDLALAAVLIRPLGVWGAVAAAVAAQTVSLLAMAAIQVRHSVLRWQDLARTCMPALLAGLAAVVTALIWQSSPGLAWSVAAYLLAIAGWVAGTRFLLNSADLEDLRNVANILPRPMASAIRAAARGLERAA